MVEIDGMEDEYTPEDIAAIEAWFKGKNYIPIPDDMCLCPLIIKETVENV